MHSDDIKVWGIHTQDDELFLGENKIAIGWKKFGDLSKIKPASKDAFKEQYMKVYPESLKKSMLSSVGMLYRFIYEIQVNDYIIYPSKKTRMINIGKVIGEYSYNEKAIEYVNQRDVKWIKHIPRTSFSQAALYEIGAAMSLFTIKNNVDEFLSYIDDKFKHKQESKSDDVLSIISACDMVELTKDFILNTLSQNLKGFAIENFIANLLEAMGYRTTISKKGGDSGIDIIAYKDELPPRIVVQVKSGNDKIRETTIQSLKGAKEDGDYGLFVTLSGYTQNAIEYLKKNPSIRGIDGNELCDLILKYYDKLDDDYKKLIPLKLVYIPEIDDNHL